MLDNEASGQQSPDATGIANDPGFIIVPVIQPETHSEEDYHSSSHSSDSDRRAEKKLEKKLSKSTLAVFSVSDSPQETAETIRSQSGVQDDDAIKRVSGCAAFWRSLGVETLIYMSSYGGTLIASGLIIRFTGFNPLISSLLLGNVGTMLSPHMQLILTSLIKPPKETVPDERQYCQDLLNKYAFLPISWLLSAGISGTALSILRDPSFSTQQIVGVVSAVSVGPIIHGLKVGARKCLSGAVDMAPEYPGVTEALATAYGTDPNPYDDNRPYRWDTVVSVLQRAITLSAGTTILFYNAGFNVETYCIDGGAALRTLTSQGNYTITGADVEQNCWGGGITYVFRELGVSATYAFGMMVVEPATRWLLNKVFDYFYQPAPDGSSDSRVSEAEDD